MTNKGPQQIKREEQRAEKLEAIQEQIADGKLKVRQMTAAERKQHPKPIPRGNDTPKRNYAARQRGR